MQKKIDEILSEDVGGLINHLDQMREGHLDPIRVHNALQ
jgi:hypothetical protein